MSYFKETERLITLSQDIHEKQQIEQGINRYLQVVTTIEGLVETVEYETSRNDKVHILATSSMSPVFKQHIKDVVAGLNALTALKKVQVVEIGIGKVFENALTFGDTLTFIEFCRTEERVQYIMNLEKQGGEQKEESRILRELLIERDAANERVEQLEGELKEQEQTIQDLDAKYQALETKVNHVYVIELENAKVELEQKLAEQEEYKRLHQLEQAKVAEYTEEANKYRSLNKGLELDKRSLEKALEERREQIIGLKAQKRKLENDLENAGEELKSILKKRVDAEVHVQLVQNLAQERERVRNLEAQIQTLAMESRKKDFEIGEYLREISELRQGAKMEASQARNVVLDNIHFKTVNVYYVKIIQPLPYLNSALKWFYDAIKKREGGRTHVCILKHDDGLNDSFFRGYELYGTLGDVQAKHEKFMLFPSRRMFTGAEKFDASVNAVLVLDYIQSSDYYMTTDAFHRVMTVCQRSSQMNTLKLTGTVVSLDSDSLLNLNYDTRIATAATEEMQQRFIKGKVDDWMKKLDMD